MNARTMIVGFMGMACVVCLLLAGRVDSAETDDSAAAAFKPVSSVHSLMEGQGMFFKKIGDSLKDPGAPRRTKEIAFGAELLAELANVNTYNRTEADYVEWASQVRETALELAGEARKKEGQDDTKMKELFARIEAACTACHEKYQ